MGLVLTAGFEMSYSQCCGYQSHTKDKLRFCVGIIFKLLSETLKSIYTRWAYQKRH